jgi:hypothetical protein
MQPQQLETAEVIEIDGGYFHEINRRGTLRVARTLAAARLFPSRREAESLCATLAWKGWNARSRTVALIDSEN